jgi:hypothetical protein
VAITSFKPYYSITGGQILNNLSGNYDSIIPGKINNKLGMILSNWDF